MSLKSKVLVSALILSAIINTYFLVRRLGPKVDNSTPYNYLSNAQYGEQTKIFQAYDFPCSIALIGDSHIYKCHWSELLGAICCNRGIGSDIAEGVFKRVADIVRTRPRICFIAIGSNDIDTKVPEDVTVSFVKKTVDALKAAGIKVVIMEITPVSATYTNQQFNVAAQKLNTRYREICETISITLEAGDRQEDGIHLTASGYEKWKIAISRLISSLIYSSNLPSLFQ
jgi:hypothetical protein